MKRHLGGVHDGDSRTRNESYVKSGTQRSRTECTTGTESEAHWCSVDASAGDSLVVQILTKSDKNRELSYFSPCQPPNFLAAAIAAKLNFYRLHPSAVLQYAIFLISSFKSYERLIVASKVQCNGRTVALIWYDNVIDS